MSSNVKRAKTAASVTNSAAPLSSPIEPSVNYGMQSGPLPPASMLLHTNESNHSTLNPNDSPMNSYADLFNSRPSAANNGKANKRKLDELGDSSSTDLDSSSTLKPQKTDPNDSDRTLTRTDTPLSNGPPPSSTPSRTNNDIGPPPYDFAPSTNTNTNNNNNGNSTPNPSLLTQQAPSPAQPPSLPHQTSIPSSLQPGHGPPPPPHPSSYMHHMSPRNQFNMTSDSPYLQTNNQVFVFTTQLANDAAEAVLNNEYPTIIDYHKSLPSTAQYLASLSNNNHNPLLSGPPMHMNPPQGCHSPRTMQMMMPGPPPPHHPNPHMPMHNGNLGPPPPNWPHPHFHQQQPPFGRLTPGPGGLPPPNHLMPPGAMMMNGPSPSPGMRMGGMPGMSPMPSEGIENLTPERAKHRKNQLNKIEDLKNKISGRARGGRTKAAAGTPGPPGAMPPSMNGGPLPPGPMDPHQQQMMMMNSPHGVGPPHHMMGIGPPPPHMLHGGMRGPPDGMMLDMNGPPPPHGYMNGPMPPGFHGQYGGPPPTDPYGGPLPPSHPQSQAVREWNKMQMEHLETKAQHMRGQPPPYPSPSPSSLTPPIASTSAGPMIGPNGKLISPRMEPSSAPRLYKVGQPEKFIPDSLPSTNKKLHSNVGDVQMTASPTQMDYNEFGLEGEELHITRHLNRAYRPGNAPIPSSSSSCKDEPLTPSNRSTSTPNNNHSNLLSSGSGLQPSSQSQQQQPPSGSTTPTHGPPSHLTPQSVPAASPRSSKLNANNNNTNLASPLMFSNNNNNSTKDEPLDSNGDPKTPTSNMAPPLNSMLQMTNSLQSANSPYNPSNNQGSKSSMPSPNYGPMSKAPPMEHMNLPPQHMSFQSMSPHHRMVGPPDSMPPHFNPHHPGNLPPPHPHMYRMMPPHHGMDPNGMMMGHPPGPPGRSSKPHPLHPPSGDPMQSHLHHLPPPHYMKMSNMDPSMMGPGPPQQHMRFPPMMDEGYGMGPPPPHPHHPHMHPHHPMHLNDSRLPPPGQSIHNTYVSTTMSIQQINIQNLGPGGAAGELQSGTIHYHAPSSNGPDSQAPSYLTNDPSYPHQFNDLQGPPSNLSGDGVPPPNYW